MSSGPDRRRPPRRPAWHSLLLGLVGFLLPFSIIAWAGDTANRTEEIVWHRNWDELHGRAAGPVEDSASGRRQRVLVRTPGGHEVERRLPVVQLRPAPDQWERILSAEEGDPVPLVRRTDDPDTLLVSPHFERPGMGQWLVAGAAIGAANGLLLALVYRRRHRM